MELVGEAMKRNLGRALAIALLVTLVCVFVPLSPKMPQGSLDPSWAFGMNQAVANGLIFGKAMVFTFGPYASIYTGLYHPATDLLMVLGSLYLAVSSWFAVLLVARGGRMYPVAGLVGILAALLYSRDALLFLYPLLVALYCYRYADAEVEDGRELAVLGLLFTPFGLLPLIKGSLLVLCGGIGGLAFLLLASRNRWSACAVAILSSVLSMAVFWIAAGQPLSALPDWFLSMVPIVSGYTEAMSRERAGWEVVGYLMASLALLVLVYRVPHASPSSRTYATLAFAVYLFLAFKGGFVRHDVHAMMAGTALLFAAVFAAMLFRSPQMPAMLVASLVVCVFINGNYQEVSLLRVAENARATYAQAWTGLRMRVADDRGLAKEYEQALSALRSQVAIPRLPGTSDIYSYQQSYLLASGNQWNPRPVLQSYSAYTPSLLEANKAHLVGKGAPDYIVFRVETIDGRLPSSEDGASWPTLLSHYRLVGEDAAFLYLRRQEVPGRLDEQVTASGSYALGDSVALPGTSEPVFVRIDLQPSFAGKLVSTFYKPSQVVIRVDLENGSSRLFRIVPGMVRTGVLMSPLVESNAEFGSLYKDQGRLAPKRVKSFAIAPVEGLWQWSPRYDVRFVRYTASSTAAPTGVASP